MPERRRIARLNKTLAKEVSEVIQKEIKDPRLLTMVSVVEASISPDLSNLKIYISLFGSSEVNQLKTLEALQSASGFISSLVSKRLRLRVAPQISFIQTHKIEDGVNMYFRLKEMESSNIIEDDEGDEPEESNKK